VATPAEAAGETEVDPVTRRKITLLVEKVDGAAIEVVTLRPLEWLATRAAELQGGRVWLDIDAIGLHDWASVITVEPCPIVSEGRGRVVLTTITQVASSLMEIRFVGGDDVLQPTPSHRLYSASRDDWIRAENLAVGEKLATASGTTTIESITQNYTPCRVYNLEVEFDHCYYTGAIWVLSHNACPHPLSGEAKNAFRAEARNIWQDLTGKRAIWDDLQVHHRIPLEWSHYFPDANPNRVTNLVGINPQAHTQVTNAWNAWRLALNGRVPTQADIIRQAVNIDNTFINYWVFPK
jgi:hypothetical protein